MPRRELICILGQARGVSWIFGGCSSSLPKIIFESLAVWIFGHALENKSLLHMYNRIRLNLGYRSYSVNKVWIWDRHWVAFFQFQVNLNPSKSSNPYINGSWKHYKAYNKPWCFSWMVVGKSKYSSPYKFQIEEKIHEYYLMTLRKTIIMRTWNLVKCEAGYFCRNTRLLAYIVDRIVWFSM